MFALSMALDIAELVDDARDRAEPIDIESEAHRLMQDHPEAGLSAEEIARVLQEERALPPFR